MQHEPTRIWITIPKQEIIDYIGQKALTPEILEHFCKYNPQLLNEAVQAIATVRAEKYDLAVVPIAAVEFSVKDYNSIECLLFIEGHVQDIEKFNGIAQRICIDPELPPIETPAYEAMKKSAFNLMRKNNIQDFSAEELHRVFKHAKEQLLYTSIVRMAIEDGLTIESLYEQDRDHGFVR